MSITLLACEMSAEYSMRNAGLEETQAGIKIAGRNINNQKQKTLRSGGKNTQKNCIKKRFTTQIIMML